MGNVKYLLNFSNFSIAEIALPSITILFNTP